VRSHDQVERERCRREKPGRLNTKKKKSKRRRRPLSPRDKSLEKKSGAPPPFERGPVCAISRKKGGEGKSIVCSGSKSKNSEGKEGTATSLLRKGKKRVGDLTPANDEGKKGPPCPVIRVSGKEGPDAR